MFKLEVIVTTFRKLFCMKLPSQILLVLTLMFGTVVSGNGPTIYTDSQATNFPKRFYIITVP